MDGEAGGQITVQEADEKRCRIGPTGPDRQGPKRGLRAWGRRKVARSPAAQRASSQQQTPCERPPAAQPQPDAPGPAPAPSGHRGRLASGSASPPNASCDATGAGPTRRRHASATVGPRPPGRDRGGDADGGHRVPPDQRARHGRDLLACHHGCVAQGCWRHQPCTPSTSKAETGCWRNQAEAPSRASCQRSGSHWLKPGPSPPAASAAEPVAAARRAGRLGGIMMRRKPSRLASSRIRAAATGSSRFGTAGAAAPAGVASARSGAAFWLTGVPSGCALWYSPLGRPGGLMPHPLRAAARRRWQLASQRLQRPFRGTAAQAGPGRQGHTSGTRGTTHSSQGRCMRSGGTAANSSRATPPKATASISPNAATTVSSARHCKPRTPALGLGRHQLRIAGQVVDNQLRS